MEWRDVLMADADEVPEEVRDMIAHTVKDSRERIVFSDDAPPIHDDNERFARATDPATGESVILAPDPKTILKVACANCGRHFFRSRREVERMNRKFGFPWCRKACRVEKLAEKERVIAERIFVADRDETEADE